MGRQVDTRRILDIATHEAATVRKATAGEWERLASVLARAFHDDPAVQWAMPDESSRERAFGLYLRKLWLEQDECYTTDGVAGVCVWELPGQWKVPVLQQLRLLPAMISTFGRGLPRVMRALTALESNHPVEDHYYLPFVGIAPEWQRRGIGAALMRPILDRCDREGVGAYLEATTPRNLALYERHGFAITEKFTLGKDSPPLWRMWRKPAG
ncbi:MAG: GNAT family N-acetyltransferase [Deltaproteobacteria bacterium]|nr:GNAT family N-acetyltransferase [Deltaproteobacteria bacterium]